MVPSLHVMQVDGGRCVCAYMTTIQTLFFYKKKNRKLAKIQPSLQFFGMKILVKTKSLCKGMAAMPFQKFYTHSTQIFGILSNLNNVLYKFHPNKKINFSEFLYLLAAPVNNKMTQFTKWQIIINYKLH